MSQQKTTLLGATALAAAGVLLYAAVSRFASSPSGEIRPELAQLVTAIGQRRTFQPRVTGGFEYGEVVAAPTRSAGPADDGLPLKVRAASLELEKRAVTRPSAMNAFGIAQLVTGQSERAVATLEQAVRLDPKDSRLLSDMAAAYLVRSADADRFEDVARAVGFAQRATEINPGLAEARFNLALSLEELALRGEAGKAWQSYLEIDRHSPWAGEASRHLAQLAETPEQRWDAQRRVITAAGERGDEGAIRTATRQFPDTAYEYVENDLVPAWADAWLARDVEKARRKAVLASRFGQALADAVGDRMALDAAVTIERLQKAGDRQPADALARGHQLFRNARALVDQDRLTEAAALFTKAEPAFVESRSPFAAWVTLYLAVDAFYRRQLDGAANHLAPLLDTTASQAYLTLGGRANRVRGLIHLLSGQFGDALDRYRRALDDFSKAGAHEDIALLHSTLAETLEQVGDYKTAWSHWRLALRGLSSARTPRRRQTILATAAIATKQARLFAVDLQIQNELLADALQTGRAGVIVDALIGRAEAWHSLGDEPRAAQDVKAAEEWLAQVSDPELARSHDAELRLIKGEILERSEPEQALTALKDSLAYFEKSKMVRRVPRVSLAMGRAHHRAGRDGAAEMSFLAGIRELERYRAEVPPGELRLAYFEQPWNLFDEMIALQAGRPERASQALTFAERARARDLLDRASRSSQEGLVDPASLTGTLPAGTVVIYYASLDTQLLTWIISHGRVELYRRPIGAAELSRHAQALAAAIQSDRANEIDVESTFLYDEVIRPVETHLAAGGNVLVIPDGPLHGVPFAALQDSRTGRYLVEDHLLAVAPSATMFQRASSRLKGPRLAAAKRMLVIGNPQLDRSDGEGLPNLSGAEGEARDIATIFPSAVVLTAARATKRSFLDGAAGAGIVHFGGHALANERYPLMSRLLLARDGEGRSGSLFAHEILNLDLAATNLLVLAACSTAAGPIVKGEGPMSLARPFLAAGVPSVVATLWDVDDGSSRRFFSAFYRSLSEGNEPVQALRNGQLALLHGNDRRLKQPAAWAGFVVIGGALLNGGH